MNILNQIVVIMLNISLWSGRKKLRPEDLAANGIEVDKLPPGTLASLGTKRIIAPEALNPFSALKREAERICLAKGARFLGGFAIPKENADQLVEELKEIKQRFQETKESLLSDYDKEIDKWIAENPPEWAAVIRAAIEPASIIDQAMHFNFAPVVVGSPEGMEDANEGLDEETDGLLGQLYHEVRMQAKTAFEASFVGRKEITRKAIRPILSMREKLMGLSFLAPEIAETIQAIDQVIDKVPKTGPIIGTDLDMIAGLVGRRLANIGCPLPPEPEPEPEAVEEEAPAEVGVEVHEERMVFNLPPTLFKQKKRAPLVFDF